MNHFDTVIVGAGVAGLTAARLLASHRQRVVVLEARNRIGGRTWTERSGDGREAAFSPSGPTLSVATAAAPVDLGASWIHGIDNSALAAAAEGFGLRTREFTVGSFQPGGRRIAYFDADGKRLSESAAEAFIADVHLFDQHLTTAIAATKLGASYSDAVEAALEGLGWEAARSERIREFMQHRSEEQYGAWIGDLDAHGLDDDNPEGDEVIFPDGFDELAARLAAGIDVRLEHVVSRVVRGDGGVTVTTPQGDFTADRVIVTVPVGMLQSGEFVFDPPLPDRHASALAGLTMNAFEKVFVQFPYRFWAEESEDALGQLYAIRQQGAAGDWWHSWYDLTPMYDTPTLLTFAAGPCARETRGWSDERIIDSVLSALRPLYGGHVPEPTGARITRWQADPYTRGSYAYLTAGSRPEDHDTLAEPIDGMLHIAGEATWADDPATVTAALCSGHRAAENVLGEIINIARLWQA